MASKGREDALTKTRRKLQEAVERAEAEHRRQLLQKRIELANEGVRAMRQDKPVDAIRAFHIYLRILEDWKGVAEGGLSPSHFDLKKDAAELLLISGVYWDLVRIYDKTKTPEKRKDFLHYMEKFVLFSKGMPYQGLCSETIRKYIATSKPKHKDEFKNTYRLLSTSKCYVATALNDVIAPETLPRLRALRDERLLSHPIGKVFVAAYYASGPALARLTDRLPGGVRRKVGLVLDRLALAAVRRPR